MKKLLSFILLASLLILISSPVVAATSNEQKQDPSLTSTQLLDTTQSNDINDPAQVLFGKYKDTSIEEAENFVKKKGGQGIRLTQTTVLYWIVFLFIIAIAIVATGSVFQHSFVPHGVIGAIICIIAFVCVLNAPMIMRAANGFLTH